MFSFRITINAFVQEERRLYVCASETISYIGAPQGSCPDVRFSFCGWEKGMRFCFGHKVVFELQESQLQKLDLEGVRIRFSFTLKMLKCLCFVVIFVYEI